MKLLTCKIILYTCFNYFNYLKLPLIVLTISICFSILELRFGTKSVASKYMPEVLEIFTKEYDKLGEYTIAIFPGNVHGVVVQIRAYVGSQLRLLKSIEIEDGHSSNLKVIDLL